MARKPWLVISSLSNPRRRSATFSVLSENAALDGVKRREEEFGAGRITEITDACRASGIACGCFIFMRSAGTRQTFSAKSIRSTSPATAHPDAGRHAARS